VVGPSGGEDRGVLTRGERIDPGVRVGQREHDGIRCHAGDVVAGEEVWRGHADGDAGVHDALDERVPRPAGWYWRFAPRTDPEAIMIRTGYLDGVLNDSVVDGSGHPGPGRC
jgi:hypothetical protein